MIPITHLALDIKSILTQFKATHTTQKYWDTLSAENEKVNLVSRETDLAAFKRLVAQSLLPITQIKNKFETYLDIGSGGGLPAIPIIMAGMVTGPVTLYERTNKKAAALGRIVTALELPKTTVVPESFGEKPIREKFSLVTMSYVNLTRSLLDTISNSLSAKGTFIYYSGPDFDTKKLKTRRFTYSQFGSGVDRHFTVFSK